MLHTEILDTARGFADRIVALRRAIHAEPELGLDNPRTRDKLRAALAHLPLEWREGPSTTGLVARLVGTAPATGPLRRVVLRGDTDALPMDEETGLPFASQVPGAMHSCGHDTHAAMLAGAVDVLCARRDRFAGEVLFMFQPGEEGFHGARFMLDDGLLDPLPDAAFALHVMPDSGHGVVAGRAGALLASADRFEITVEGRGGHASMPHQTLDPMPIACEIVTALQTMVTRRFPVADPVVVTVSQIHAGTAHNVIPDRAVLKGTIRTLSPHNRVAVHEQLITLATGIAAAHGLSASAEVFEGFPVTLCDARGRSGRSGGTRDRRALALSTAVASDHGRRRLCLCAGKSAWRDVLSGGRGARG